MNDEELIYKAPPIRECFVFRTADVYFADGNRGVFYANGDPEIEALFPKRKRDILFCSRCGHGFPVSDFGHSKACFDPNEEGTEKLVCPHCKTGLNVQTWDRCLTVDGRISIGILPCWTPLPHGDVTFRNEEDRLVFRIGVLFAAGDCVDGNWRLRLRHAHHLLNVDKTTGQFYCSEAEPEPERDFRVKRVPREWPSSDYWLPYVYEELGWDQWSAVSEAILKELYTEEETSILRDHYRDNLFDLLVINQLNGFPIRERVRLAKLFEWPTNLEWSDYQTDFRLINRYLRTGDINVLPEYMRHREAEALIRKIDGTLYFVYRFLHEIGVRDPDCVRRIVLPIAGSRAADDGSSRGPVLHPSIQTAMILHDVRDPFRRLLKEAASRRSPDARADFVSDFLHSFAIWMKIGPAPSKLDE